MKKSPVNIILFAIMFFSVSVFSDTDTNSLKLVQSKNGIKNIYYRGSNLTKFTKLHEIYAYQISPNGLWALVWHQDFRPLKLTIYDLQKQKLLKEFIPGFGGTISWTAYNNISHEWGCGTNCVNIAVYNVQGENIFGGNYCGIDIAPSKKYFATFPYIFACDPFIKIFSFNDLKIIYSSKQEDDVRYLNDISWRSDEEIRINYQDSNDIEQSITINLKKK